MRLLQYSDVDDYVLEEHQHLADWIYTKFDKSPYETGSYCFAACLVTNLLTSAIMFFRYDQVLIANAIVFFLGLIFYGMFFLASQHIEEKWKSSPEMMPFDISNFLPYRVMFTFFFVLGVFLMSLSIIVNEKLDLNLILFLERIFSFVGIHLVCCRPPTRMQQRDEIFGDLQPDTT